MFVGSTSKTCGFLTLEMVAHILQFAIDSGQWDVSRPALLKEALDDD
jgi:hypothetical protein